MQLVISRRVDVPDSPEDLIVNEAVEAATASVALAAYMAAHPEWRFRNLEVDPVSSRYAYVDYEAKYTVGEISVHPGVL